MKHVAQTNAMDIIVRGPRDLQIDIISLRITQCGGRVHRVYLDEGQSELSSRVSPQRGFDLTFIVILPPQTFQPIGWWLVEALNSFRWGATGQQAMHLATHQNVPLAYMTEPSEIFLLAQRCGLLREAQSSFVWNGIGPLRRVLKYLGRIGPKEISRWIVASVAAIPAAAASLQRIIGIRERSNWYFLYAAQVRALATRLKYAIAPDVEEFANKSAELEIEMEKEWLKIGHSGCSTIRTSQCRR